MLFTGWCSCYRKFKLGLQTKLHVLFALEKWFSGHELRDKIQNKEDWENYCIWSINLFINLERAKSFDSFVNKSFLHCFIVISLSIKLEWTALEAGAGQGLKHPFWF